MLNSEITEVFTARELIDLGITKAIKEGNCIIEGIVKMTPEGFINYEFKPFNFMDNKGNLRSGRLKQTYYDAAELSILSSLLLYRHTSVN